MKSQLTSCAVLIATATLASVGTAKNYVTGPTIYDGEERVAALLYDNEPIINREDNNVSFQDNYKLILYGDRTFKAGDEIAFWIYSYAEDVLEVTKYSVDDQKVTLKSGKNVRLPPSIGNTDPDIFDYEVTYHDQFYERQSGEGKTWLNHFGYHYYWEIELDTNQLQRALPYIVQNKYLGGHEASQVYGIWYSSGDLKLGSHELMTSITKIDREPVFTFSQTYEFDQTTKLRTSVDGRFFDSNLAYLAITSTVIIERVIEMFYFRSASNYYSDGDILGGDFLGTNWWQLSHHAIFNYADLVIGSTLILSQLISMFGLLNEYNVLVWRVGLYYIMPLLSSIQRGLGYYAYDKAYQIANETGNANASAAATLQSTISHDASLYQLLDTARYFAYYFNYDYWKFGQDLYAVPANQRVEYLEQMFGYYIQ